MKSIQKILFGSLSSLLFSVGLHAAGERLDPVTKSLNVSVSDSVATGSPNCVSLCDIVEKEK